MDTFQVCAIVYFLLSEEINNRDIFGEKWNWSLNLETSSSTHLSKAIKLKFLFCLKFLFLFLVEDINTFLNYKHKVELTLQIFFPFLFSSLVIWWLSLVLLLNSLFFFVCIAIIYFCFMATMRFLYSNPYICVCDCFELLMFSFQMHFKNLAFVLFSSHDYCFRYDILHVIILYIP